MGLYPTNGSGFTSCQMRCRENIQRARDGCHKPLEVGKHYFKLSSEDEKKNMSCRHYVIRCDFGLNVKKSLL